MIFFIENHIHIQNPSFFNVVILKKKIISNSIYNYKTT